MKRCQQSENSLKEELEVIKFDLLIFIGNPFGTNINNGHKIYNSCDGKTITPVST